MTLIRSLSIAMLLTAACNSSKPEERAGLRFAQNARGCEVLLHDTDGGKISRVEFAEGVKGKWLRQGDKVSAAFIAEKDAPMGAVQVAYAGSFDIMRSHCYGTDGVEIPGATVTR